LGVGDPEPSDCTATALEGIARGHVATGDSPPTAQGVPHQRMRCFTPDKSACKQLGMPPNDPPAGSSSRTTDEQRETSARAGRP